MERFSGLKMMMLTWRAAKCIAVDQEVVVLAAVFWVRKKEARIESIAAAAAAGSRIIFECLCLTQVLLDGMLGVETVKNKYMSS